MLESFEWHTKSQPELDSTPSETTTTAKFLHNPAISFTRKTTSHWFSSQKEAERKCLNWHLSFLVFFFKKKRSTVLRSVDPIDTILFFLRQHMWWTTSAGMKRWRDQCATELVDMSGASFAAKGTTKSTEEQTLLKCSRKISQGVRQHDTGQLMYSDSSTTTISTLMNFTRMTRGRQRIM